MKKILALAAALVVALAIVPNASATIVVYDLCVEFSGAFPPEGPGPWLRATFDDFGGTGTVRLTMEAIGLVDNEFVSEWSFNFDPSLDPMDLTIAAVDISDATVNAVNTGANAFAADGDGFFDIQFDFAPPPGSFGPKFTAGEQMVFDFTLAGITANSFAYQSVGGGGAGSFFTAAHVQGIGPDDAQSGWIGDCPPVPEPTSMLLLGLGLTGMAGLGLNRRRRKQ